LMGGGMYLLNNQILTIKTLEDKWIMF
jgi:hypothetical protein